MVIPAGLRWEDIKDSKKEEANESLNENKQLHEDYSASMPLWLRSRLLKYRINSKSRSYVSKRDQYISNGYNMLNQSPTRVRGRYTYSNILDGLEGEHVDLSRANFIEAPLPKNQDPIIHDTERYIPIFHLVDDVEGVDTVYIRGINDNEQYPKPINGHPDVMMKYLSYKNLKALTKDFCYLDKQDPENFNTQLRSDRNDVRNELVNTTNYFRKDKYPDAKNNSNTRWARQANWRDKFDKSGYFIEPLDKRYAEEIKKLGYAKISDNIREAYNKLTFLKNSVSSMMNNWNIFDKDDDFATVIRTNALDSLKDAGIIYNEVKDMAEAAATTTNEDERKRLLDELVAKNSWTASIYHLQNLITDAEKRILEVLPIPMDWEDGIVDEEELGESLSTCGKKESLTEETVGEVAAEAEAEAIDSEVEDDLGLDVNAVEKPAFDDEPDEALFSKFI